MNHARKLVSGAALGLALTLGLATAGFAQAPAADQPAAPATAIDFGDNSSEWANDVECDDPRFEGAGMARELEDVDIARDAADCKAAFDAGTITLRDAAAAPVADQPAPTAEAPAAALPEFGDDAGQYPNDGDCDDPRFEGTGAVETADEIDILHDATDCRAAFGAGTATLKSDHPASADFVQPAIDAVDFGDDNGGYPRDGECDDPRFEGTAEANEPNAGNIMHDATDCRATYAAGTVTMRDMAPIPDFEYGNDTSRYANDGECDDPRFEGPGTDKKLLAEDRLADASDCRALVQGGTVTPRPVYQASYAAQAPYDADAAGIDFGDDTSSYAHDGECDDPRFEGPGMASDLLYENQWHDGVDCRTAYENGTVALAR